MTYQSPYSRTILFLAQLAVLGLMHPNGLGLVDILGPLFPSEGKYLWEKPFCFFLTEVAVTQGLGWLALGNPSNLDRPSALSFVCPLHSRVSYNFYKDILEREVGRRGDLPFSEQKSASTQPWILGSLLLLYGKRVGNISFPVLQLADASVSGIVDCDPTNPSPDRKPGHTSKTEISMEACSLGGSVWVTRSVPDAGKATGDAEDIAFFWVDNMTGTLASVLCVGSGRVEGGHCYSWLCLCLVRCSPGSCWLLVGFCFHMSFPQCSVDPAGTLARILPLPWVESLQWGIFSSFQVCTIGSLPKWVKFWNTEYTRTEASGFYFLVSWLIASQLTIIGDYDIFIALY